MINFLYTGAIDWPRIWVITVIGYCVVFFALVLLIFMFKIVARIINSQTQKRLKKAGVEIDPSEKKEKYISGEVNAAIGMALILYFNEQHDEESNIITIKRVARTYSPWSSKIYGTSANILPPFRR